MKLSPAKEGFITDLMPILGVPELQDPPCIKYKNIGLMLIPHKIDYF